MADEQQAKFDFNEILQNIHRKYDIIHARWSEDRHFEIKFRTQIPRNNEDFNTLCDEWVDIFSEVTNTVWVKKISNTGPKIKFRKQYQCWTQGGKVVQKELLFDARRCRATLDMKVLTDNPQTRKKNKHIKLGLNAVVKMNFTHLHTTNPIERFAFFVHECEPQIEPPKATVYPNDKLPNLVAKMVQKGLDFTAKAAIPQDQSQLPPPPVQQKSADTLLDNGNGIIQQSTHDTLLQSQTLATDNQLEMHNLEPTIHLNQLVPLQSMDSIKLEVPQFQQVTQVLVSDSDIGEPILFCQPTIMLDPSQMIPVSAHSFSSHFVQLHPSNLSNQQGQYL